MILDKLRAKFAKPNLALAKNIADIGLSARTYHILRRSGIATVGDLARLSWRDIAGMRRANRKLCVEVEGILKGLGLGLKEE